MGSIAEEPAAPQVPQNGETASMRQLQPKAPDADSEAKLATATQETPVPAAEDSGNITQAMVASNSVDKTTMNPVITTNAAPLQVTDPSILQQPLITDQQSGETPKLPELRTNTAAGSSDSIGCSSESSFTGASPTTFYRRHAGRSRGCRESYAAFANTCECRSQYSLINHCGPDPAVATATTGGCFKSFCSDSAVAKYGASYRGSPTTCTGAVRSYADSAFRSHECGSSSSSLAK